VEAADIGAAISTHIDFQKRANQRSRRKVLHGETNGLCGFRNHLRSTDAGVAARDSDARGLGAALVVEAA